MMVIFLNK